MSDRSWIDSADRGASRLVDTDPRLLRRANLHLQLLPALTPSGAEQVRMPVALHREIEAWLQLNRRRAQPENVPGVVDSHATDVPAELVPLGQNPLLERRIVSELQPTLERWCGYPLKPIWAFGIRVYGEGSVLHRHVDLVETHAISAALQISQDLDEAWPLVVEDFHGSRREFVLNPGDAVLYEGAKLPHYRDTPLRGRSYAAIFVHYRPHWWRFTEEHVDNLLKELPPSYPRRSLRYGSSRATAPSTGSLATSGEATRYLAFEIDVGGWNNILMQFEIMVVLAWLTGRVLVLPPATPFYLLGETPRSLLDFLDLDALRGQLPVLTAEEFAAQSDRDADLTSHEGFHQAMRIHGFSPAWNALEDVLVHPPDALERRPELRDRIVARRVVHYSGEAADCNLLYFPMDMKKRMLGVAECFFLLGEEGVERRARTLLREAVRYRPEILALAERALEAPALAGGAFSSLHVRRNDFQYGETRIEAKTIARHTKVLLVPGQTIYLATDEPELEFFRALRERFHVVTFDRLPGAVTSQTPEHWRGIVETLICAGAPGRFVGTRLSTFSARIATLRGHLSLTLDGDCEGIDTTLYYTQPRPRASHSPGAKSLPEPFAHHLEAFEETALPWWESIRTVPLWGRTYRNVWTQTD